MPKAILQTVTCKGCGILVERAELRLSRAGHIKESLCKSCRAENYKTFKLRSGRNPTTYRQFIGEVCERCGFTGLPCQLDVDHIDGNCANNDPANLQTLCANCHRLKTYMPTIYAQSECLRA